MATNNYSISDIEKLDYNWDGNGAGHIPSKITAFIKKLLPKLKSEPTHIFPCSIPGVALHYLVDKNNELLLIFHVGHVLIYSRIAGEQLITKEELDLEGLAKLINRWTEQRIN